MKKQKSGSIIGLLIVVVLIALAIGLIVRFAVNGNSTFYVIADGQTYSREGIYTLKDGDNRFVTKYIYSGDSEELHGGYTLSVVPDTDNDFWFTVDGTDEKLSLLDLSEAFDIEQDKTSFTISYDGGGIDGILAGLYPDQVVELDDDLDRGLTFVKLIIESADGNSVVIHLQLGIAVNGVDLDQEGIIF